MWTQIASQITQVTGIPFQVSSQQPVGGGCINQTHVLSDGTRSFFVKVNQAHLVDMFAAEAQGLQHIWDSQTIRVPQPICWGTDGNLAYLVLECLSLGRGTPQVWQQMGQDLAAMHRVASPQGFGWDRHNTIGATPQMNTWTADWADFFSQQRLGYQLQLARRKGARFPKQEHLCAAIPQLLNHHPQPSLVHGDLWSGNVAISQAGEPVIFDPATYFGDREVDLAMTELFGRFPAAFYQGYQDAYPLDPGYQLRKQVYNLYHVINHFNLFGGSYEAQANRMIAQLVG
jgi:fructosamine-3-kinase